MQKPSADRNATRRKPRSRIASEIVDAILDAATEVIASEGAEGLNTNRLAKRAGVSIGSLYHYFPNKESIVVELARRLETRGLEMFEQRYASVAGRSGREQIAALTAVLTSRNLGPPAVRRALLRDVPRRWIEPSIVDRDSVLRGALEKLFSDHGERTRPGDHALMALVTKWAVHGIIEGVLTMRPDLLDSPELAEEIATLVGRYTAMERPK